MGSILGGIFGGGSTPAQAGQQAAIKATQHDLAAYRPEAMQARLNALSNASTAYQGMNNALETLWGAPSGGAPVGVTANLRTNFGPAGIGPRLMGHDLPQAVSQDVPAAPVKVGHGWFNDFVSSPGNQSPDGSSWKKRFT